MCCLNTSYLTFHYFTLREWGYLNSSSGWAWNNPINSTDVHSNLSTYTTVITRVDFTSTNSTYSIPTYLLYQTLSQYEINPTNSVVHDEIVFFRVVTRCSIGKDSIFGLYTLADYVLLQTAGYTSEESIHEFYEDNICRGIFVLFDILCRHRSLCWTGNSMNWYSWLITYITRLHGTKTTKSMNSNPRPGYFSLR